MSNLTFDLEKYAKDYGDLTLQECVAMVQSDELTFHFLQTMWNYSVITTEKWLTDVSTPQLDYLIPARLDYRINHLTILGDALWKNHVFISGLGEYLPSELDISLPVDWLKELSGIADPNNPMLLS